MNYYRKYIKYKTKYINLKKEINNKIDQIGEINNKIDHIGGHLDKININNKQNIKMRIDDNINNKFPIIEKTEMEVNAFGYTHSKIIGGCLY